MVVLTITIFCTPFSDAADYTDKEHAVRIEWNYTDGRAEKIIDYIKSALQTTDVIELWHVWLMGYCEFEDRPFIHRKTVSAGELTEEHIREIVNAEIWNTPDKMYPERPSFYCLKIMK